MGGAGLRMRIQDRQIVVSCRCGLVLVSCCRMWRETTCDIFSTYDSSGPESDLQIVGVEQPPLQHCYPQHHSHSHRHRPGTNQSTR